jgi:hypothetical protein
MAGNYAVNGAGNHAVKNEDNGENNYDGQLRVSR